MKRIVSILFLILIVSNIRGQENETSVIYADFLYQRAFEKIKCMLKDSCELSIKEAVYEVENAYLQDQLNKEEFEFGIHKLASLARGVIRSNGFLYDGEDKEEMQKNAALFHVMCDTFPIQINDSTIIRNKPFTYDFSDIWGYDNWSKMFVSKLLETRTGNCHSLPLLYKIISKEIDAKAYMAIAPNHFYIKHNSKSLGWYNTELTSAAFPVDPWLMASGYIHVDAVVNRLYMEALTDKQTLAICLVDLAKGYQRRLPFGNKGFVLDCIETTLEYYPKYINALLLKVDLMQEQFLIKMREEGAENPAQILNDSITKDHFSEMERLAENIHKLGYRKMPDKMYLQWLNSLNEERERYTNKKLINFNVK